MPGENSPGGAFLFGLVCFVVFYGIHLANTIPRTEIKSSVDNNDYQHVQIDHSFEPDSTGVYDREGNLLRAYTDEDTPDTRLDITDGELRQRLDWARANVGKRYVNGVDVDEIKD